MNDQSRFDSSSVPESTHDPQPRAADPDRGSGHRRPFLGIRFRCCRTYGRIYRNDQQTAYEGQCPKCLARISVPIGSGGTTTRFFSAG